MQQRNPKAKPKSTQKIERETKIRGKKKKKII